MHTSAGHLCSGIKSDARRWISAPKHAVHNHVWEEYVLTGILTQTHHIILYQNNKYGILYNHSDLFFFINTSNNVGRHLSPMCFTFSPQPTKKSQHMKDILPWPPPYIITS